MLTPPQIALFEQELKYKYTANYSVRDDSDRVTILKNNVPTGFFIPKNRSLAAALYQLSL